MTSNQEDKIISEFLESIGLGEILLLLEAALLSLSTNFT
jgi:hypothetical protein